MYPRLLLIQVFSAVAALVVVSAPLAADPATDRAQRLVAAMTLDEKFALIRTHFGVWKNARPASRGALGSAGFNRGLPRLGIPPLQETDAGLGVANPTGAPYDATALPAALAMGASFDPKLARAAGAVVGAEARGLGFSVLLGGGADLIREPRGGRNFEYVSEDPLLTGMIAGAHVAGVQSRKVIATLKHFVLNAQENGRMVLNARLGEQAFRESDLLAFEIALEQGRPGAVMTAYNKINGAYASENAWLIEDVLKSDWGFDGWVMSDWGATHAASDAANTGLDQESGQEDDTEVFFGAPLQADMASGKFSLARLDEMVARILRPQIAAGLLDDPPHRGGQIDFTAHARVAQDVAEQGIVLLKNEAGALPLDPSVHRLLVVGGHADVGVLSGGGSSQVVPKGGIRFEGIPKKMFWGQPRFFDPDPPLAALRARLPGVDVGFVDGTDTKVAVDAAQKADAVVVFADRWANESIDLPDLALPEGKDALIAALAEANPRTIVVLESTGAVAMPWLPKVPAVLEAWYPGQSGGMAIADVLLGTVNPSGRLPVSIPRDVSQLPRPTLPDRATSASYPNEVIDSKSFDIDYNIEGADVGYKWYLRTKRTPLFPFGYGLSYTRFSVSGVGATVHNGALSVAFDVKNEGVRAGIDTPQIYLEGGGLTRRLVGWQRVDLQPGETRHVSVTADSRLLASYDVAAHGWRIGAGAYSVSVREDALREGPSVGVELPARAWPAKHGAEAVEAGLAAGRP